MKRLMPRVEAINALEPQMQSAFGRPVACQDRRIPAAHTGALSRITDEPDADPERLKQLDDERNKAINEALDEILPEASR